MLSFGAIKNSDNKYLLPAKQTGKSQAAIFALTWNRLDYSKYCFTTLFEKAGVPFDFYVVDNGSTDGTVEWLQCNEQVGRIKRVVYKKENEGIGAAFLSIIPEIEKDGWDWMVPTGNDIEVVSDNILKEIVEFSRYTKGKFFFGPKVYGIRSKIRVFKEYEMKGHPVEEIDVNGGILQTYLISILKEFLSDHQWNANQFCRWSRGTYGVKHLYLADLRVNHFETTEGQKKRYPNYPTRDWGIGKKGGCLLYTSPSPRDS